MFDISSVSKRYFDIKLITSDENGKEHALQLEVEPCRLKTMKELVSISKEDGAEAIDTLYDSMQKLLSKNKDHKKVSAEWIEALSFDELEAVMTAYFDWLIKARNNDPN